MAEDKYGRLLGRQCPQFLEEIDPFGERLCSLKVGAA